MLKAVIDSIDGLPDDVAKEYKPGTGNEAGKFVLDTEPDKHPGTLALRGAYDREKARRVELTDQVATYEEIPIGDVGDVVKWIKAGKPAGAPGEDPPDVEERLQAVRDEAKVEVDKAKAEAERERTALRGALKQSVVDRALLNDDIRAPAVLRPHVESRVDVELLDPGEGGEVKYRTIVRDAAGRPMERADLSGELISPTEFVSGLSEHKDWSVAFKASGSSGGGADRDDGGASHEGGKVVVDASDPVAFGKNAEAIGKGNAVLRNAPIGEA